MLSPIDLTETAACRGLEVAETEEGQHTHEEAEAPGHHNRHSQPVDRPQATVHHAPKLLEGYEHKGEVTGCCQDHDPVAHCHTELVIPAVGPEDSAQGEHKEEACEKVSDSEVHEEQVGAAAERLRLPEPKLNEGIRECDNETLKQEPPNESGLRGRQNPVYLDTKPSSNEV